jgi:hypothetical protein
VEGWPQSLVLSKDQGFFFPFCGFCLCEYCQQMGLHVSLLLPQIPKCWVLWLHSHWIVLEELAWCSSCSREPSHFIQE